MIALARPLESFEAGMVRLRLMDRELYHATRAKAHAMLGLSHERSPWPINPDRGLQLLSDLECRTDREEYARYVRWNTLRGALRHAVAAKALKHRALSEFERQQLRASIAYFRKQRA